MKLTLEEAQRHWDSIPWLEKPRYDPLHQSMSVFGASQHGKTTYVIGIATMLRAAGFNVLILDKKRRFTQLDPHKVINHLQDVTGKGLQILQPLRFTSVQQIHTFFSDLCFLAYSLKNIVFIVDELHSWFKDIRTHVSSMELFCRECHNDNSSFIAIFQSPAEVPKYILRNSHHRFCLYLDGQYDIDKVRGLIGPEVELFSYGVIPKYHGFYKEQGQPIKKFKVEKP